METILIVSINNVHILEGSYTKGCGPYGNLLAFCGEELRGTTELFLSDCSLPAPVYVDTFIEIRGEFWSVGLHFTPYEEVYGKVAWDYCPRCLDLLFERGHVVTVADVLNTLW